MYFCHVMMFTSLANLHIVWIEIERGKRGEGNGGEGKDDLYPPCLDMLVRGVGGKGRRTIKNLSFPSFLFHFGGE